MSGIPMMQNVSILFRRQNNDGERHNVFMALLISDAVGRAAMLMEEAGLVPLNETRVVQFVYGTAEDTDPPYSWVRVEAWRLSEHGEVPPEFSRDDAGKLIPREI